MNALRDAQDAGLNRTGRMLVEARESLGASVKDKIEQALNRIKGDWTLSWNWSPLLSVGVILGYNTEYSGERSLKIFHEAGNNVFRQVFFAGTVSLNLSSRVIVRLLGGQLRGGPKCISGVCRILPPFAGVRVETVVRL